MTIKPGDYVRTPRFCTVQIKEVFSDREKAWEAGYREPTHYRGNDCDIFGKSLDMYHMEFAAVEK